MFLQSMYHPTYAIYGAPFMTTPTCFGAEVPSSSRHYNEGMLSIMPT